MTYENIEFGAVPVEPQQRRNWTDTFGGRSIAAAVVSAELSPLNEIIRFGSLAYAIHHGEDPLVAAGVIGATTAVVEGVAAVCAADILDSNSGQKIVQNVNDRLEKLGVSRFLRTNIGVETGIAAIGGSAVVTAAKHLQDPERSREQNRRYGLVAALGITAMSSIQGYAIAAGIEHPSPVTVGAAAVVAGAAVGGYKWTKNKLSGSTEIEHKRVNAGESPQNLGLTDEDRIGALEDPRTKYIEENGKKVPVLVPIDRLYWYNHAYLSKHFGTDEIYYYAHPDLKNESSVSMAQDQVSDAAQKGDIILYDTVTAGNVVFGDLEHELHEHGKSYRKVPITKSGHQRFLLQYDGEFIARGKQSKTFVETSTMHETYVSAVAKGDIDANPEDGPALQDVIEGAEAERLWDIYDKPFQKLSDGHPINSAYDKAEFLNILRDPEAVKAVYREQGEITTLALFVNSLDHCSWLDSRYYKSKYPEAVETGNHFIFPGIVTDELKRGASYSIPLIQLIAKVQSMRNTPAVISFECTDISYKYVPRIVRFAIAKSGVAKTKGLQQPVSRFDYYAITK